MRYPVHNRESLELRFLSSVFQRGNHEKVRFIIENDFEFKESKNIWGIIINEKCDYFRVFSKYPNLADLLYNIPEFLFPENLALLIVEANISKAYCNLIYDLALKSKDQIESNFLINTHIKAISQDALLIHKHIPNYLSPVVSNQARSKILGLHNRIENRIVKIKKHLDGFQ